MANIFNYYALFDNCHHCWYCGRYSNLLSGLFESYLAFTFEFRTSSISCVLHHCCDYHQVLYPFISPIFPHFIYQKESKMNSQSISENIRKKKRLELWALFFVYFIVSCTSSSEDLFSMIYQHTKGKCSVFASESIGHMFSNMIEHIFDLLVPMWAILIVFNIEARRAKGKSLKTLVFFSSFNFYLNLFILIIVSLFSEPVRASR